MNKKKSVVNIVCFFAISFLFFSCKLFKKTEKKADEHPVKVVGKSTKELATLLKKNEFKFNWLSAKFSVDANVDSVNNSFTVSARVRKDSVIWMSISKLGIEGARAIITKDSVRLLDRINSNYFVGDFNYINKLLHAELDFDILQSLLVGNSVDFYDEDEKLKSFVENQKYALSTIPRRKYKRMINRNIDIKDPLQVIWIEPSNFKISKILFKESNLDKRTFEADFSKFELVDSLYFPHKINFNVRAEKNISVVINYSKVSINAPQTFPFSVPEKYERVNYQEHK